MTAKKALIVGASRGLGLGLVTALSNEGWHVTATVRDPQRADALRTLDNVQVEQLDIDNLHAIKALHQRLNAEVFDLVFINAGIKGPDDQTPGSASLADIGQLFMTNSVAPINVAQAFVANIRKGDGILAFMSSRLGSVTIPNAPQLALYKASKAALNSLTNTFITQLGDERPTVLSMHPGVVKTELSGGEGDIDVDTSIRGIVEQLKAYAGKGGHHFIDYKGQTIPW
ncbi:SDR family oxidoreductase [Pseudomonas sp. CCC3.1]|uniref:SDR family oxidoreductase n=1 Tax=Pseudomonas sp. CCC3.1 TaxID=3048607 RepID=UPI002AC9E4FA|nr:SDR family oxidoreductase [Pseudomonas sp. CCC3.1]MEB0205529.1 SDR family oxidoreductase [Pseudomonas sp. CCC3.1]WPX35520.1 SDR family oxidoreductase [Pseudomonas sp. CCC3.1]